jgi:hypothetical protein
MADGEICYTRKSELHVLSGGLLEFWKRLHDISQCSDYIGRVYYANGPGSTSNHPNLVKRRIPLEIVRVVTDTGDPIVGYKAVSEQEMKFFKEQMLLPRGHPDDVWVKKHGTASANNTNTNNIKKNKNKNTGAGKKRRFSLSDMSGW